MLFVFLGGEESRSQRGHDRVVAGGEHTRDKNLNANVCMFCFEYDGILL
jgi:hypothetical protein